MKYPRQNLLLSAMLAVAAAGLVTLYFFDPATSGVFPPCPVRYLTGWYCPGCGSLRALHQLLQGNLRAAWALNPLTVVLLPFLAYGTVSYGLFELRGRRLPQLFLPAVWIRALCAVIILFGIARNIPVHPFELLAPAGVLHPSRLRLLHLQAGARLAAVFADTINLKRVPGGGVVVPAADLLLQLVNFTGEKLH
jgi:hypothetical protein